MSRAHSARKRPLSQGNNNTTTKAMPSRLTTVVGTIRKSQSLSAVKKASDMMAVDALKAFKASSRASAEEHFLDSVPDELLAASGPNLNLKCWSMLLEDEDLKK